MDIFNLTNNRLIENGFEPYDLLEIEGMGSAIYRSSIYHVVMKKIHSNEELKDIKSYSTNIRNIMLNERVNTCNTYLFFCIDKQIDYETFFRIERDTTALRKYVIRNEMDFKRIPFLDNLTEETQNGVEELKNNQDENFYLLKIYDFITSHNGHHNKLSQLEIETSVKMIIDLVEKQYES
ncbi:ABC-three component system middle component 1 [Rossellomorea sp. BNER]|uniref:ABC-three component system middle component 1 n=1 Tax=Rossellomorea sp. BNER TaxID=2962031 RepID=UPI003AF2A999|nr:hypothetical protein [Rossellomorea sp. BNER]